MRISAQRIDFSSSTERFRPIIEKWRQKAEQGIAAGVGCILRAKFDQPRVRSATALPALIGARTLALLREAGADALQKKIKVPRSEVRAIMSSITMTLLAAIAELRRNFGGDLSATSRPLQRNNCVVFL